MSKSDIGALLALAGRRRLARLAALTLAAAASEGVGLVLLVPLIASLGGGAPAPVLPGGVAPGIGLLLGGFVALVALRAAIEGARTLAAQATAAAVVDGLRTRTMDALLHAEWSYLSRLAHSAQRALLIGALDRAGEALHHAMALLRAVGLLAGLAIAACALDWRLGLAGAVVVALAAMASRPAGRTARRLGQRLGSDYRMLDSHVAETLAQLRLLKSYRGEERAGDRLAERLARLRDGERAYLRHGALIRGAFQVVAAILLAAFAGAAILRGSPAPPVLLAYVVLALRTVPLLEGLQGAWQGWHHASPALAEVLALEREARTIAEPRATGAPAPRLREALVFDEVTVRHGEGDGGLDRLSLSIPFGALAVVTGPSGAGKSTLADVAGGLIAPDAGQLRIDGSALAGEARIAWRGRVAYVQQDPVLLAGSIRDNLLLADPAADDAAIAKALAAAAAGFVADLPAGLDTLVGEGGRVLSGGERQRLALARALLRHPDLLILDEATSALDPANDAAIAAALRSLAGRITILVIAHRGALAEIADLRFALDGGRLNAALPQNSP